MFLEIAIGVKAIILILSLIGLFLGLWPEMDLFKGKPDSSVPAVVIDNEWAALAYAQDDRAQDTILQAVKSHQETAQRADDNATYVALSADRAVTVRESGFRMMILTSSLLVGGYFLACPIKRRREERA